MRWLSVICVSAVVLAGCQPDIPRRLNAPPQGYSEHPHFMQDSFEAMVDNATLADMSVADCHFAGPTDQLSGLGVWRLQKLSRMLQVYGGTLVYDTRLDDSRLVNSRLDRLRGYLASAGCDMDEVVVQVGMPSSRGMRATEAIEAMKAPTASKDEGGTSTALDPYADGGSSQ